MLLSDNDSHCHILDYRFKKLKQIVRSVMDVEVCAFMDRFDLMFFIAADLLLLIDTNDKVYIYTDPKQMLDAMTKGNHTTCNN